MTRAEALARLHEIVEGIDTTEGESDKGWWETSVGAKHGEQRLRMLEELVETLTR